MRPVAQNVQPSAHPTCELTQTEKRPGVSSGIRTVSNHVPSCVRSAYFTNAST